MSRFCPPSGPLLAARRSSLAQASASLIGIALAFAAHGDAGAGCPPGDPNPITSGSAAAGPPVVITGLGPAPTGSFFILGAGDAANSGTLPLAAWLHPAGDVDGDGRPDWYVAAPAEGPGGWGDPATVGCPSFLVPDHPPLVIILQHVVEDLDGDGKFDVFEDRNRNHLLDPGEDLDGDGRLTPPDGCEGASREDLDCDGRIDIYNEDVNGNGVLDPGEDLDNDGHLDPGTEDRNHNFSLDDRPFLYQDDAIRDESGRINYLYPYGETHPGPGGTLVLVVAWNGQAYSLQSISDPGVVVGPEEDLDHDGHFDVFEDRNHNGLLDPGEDLDGDGRLTPRGGCEGLLREDTDCDGRLDLVHEDTNGNGRLDPGEDVDGDGHLDAGDEDRNGNNMLDDRPSPQPSDALGDYPYGLFLPRPLRLIQAGPFGIAHHVTGVHTDPFGALRLRFETDGVRVLTDSAVAGPVFDHLALSLDRFTSPPGPVPPGTRRFVESLSPRLDLPSASNLSVGSFLSIDLVAPRMPHPLIALDLRARSAGSDAFLAGPHGLQGLALADLLDPDDDRLPAPFDNCPDFEWYYGLDANLDGLGDACDPSYRAPWTLFDRWVPVAAGGVGPGPRRGAAAAFDAARGVTVLFGGAEDGATWEFDGVAWHSFAASPAPAPRRGHAMAWDGDRRRVVLYGGERLSDGRTLADQWEYDAARHRWVERSLPVTPGPRAGFGLARDERLRALVLFGGHDGTRLLGDTWMFRMGAWRRIPTAQAPAPRTGAVLSYDARRERTVLVAGRGPSALGNLLDDVWEFDGAAWQPVDARGDLTPTADATLAWDPIHLELLLFGGATLHWQPGSIYGNPVVIGPMASTLRFDGVRFSPLPTLDTTKEREGHAAAFDARSGTLIVQGGASTTGPLDDTAALERGGDTDGDGVADAADDCPSVADPEQADGDADGVGDACDDCPAVANADQRDLDRDLVGDACDDDRDGDGVANLLDVCPDAYVAGRPFAVIGAGGGGDRDGDGHPDDCDRCPDDPGDDVDGDGFCAGEDNCPATANPMQQDGNGDGAGDACQPVVRILSIDTVARPRNALNARVQVRDPNGDRLFGRVEITRTIVLPEILSAGLDPCATAWSPDGGTGGVVYAVVPGSAPVITDVDAIFGCFDGLPDFEFFDGTCAEGAGRLGADAITVDHPTPFPICLRRLDGSGTQFERVLRSAGPDAALLGEEGPALSYPWHDRLPFSVPLGALGTPGVYLLRVTAGDGTTPEAADERSFSWSGQPQLFFNLPAWLTGGS